jgi:hypothetical protein
MDELLEQTDAAIKDVSGYIEEYETFLGWLDKVESDFEDFNDSEQTAFVEAFSQFTAYTKEPVSPDAVVSVRADMREVFREPLLQAILDSIRDVTDRLGLSLGDSVLNSFNNEMQTWSRAQLLDCREAFEEIESAVDGLSDSERVYIRDRIDNKPHQLLEPDTTVLTMIESVSETGAQLREISTVFSTYDWLMIEDRHIGPFSRSWLGLNAPAPAAVESIVDDIDESVTALEKSGIPVADATSSKMNTLTHHPEEDFLSELREFSETLETQATNAEPLEYISELIDIVDDLELEALNQESLREIDEMLEQGELSSLNEVIEVVAETREEYSEWVNDVATRWQTYRSAVDVLSEYTTIEPPDEFTDQDSFTTGLFERPPDALHAFERLVSSLEENRQTVGSEEGLSEESIQLLFELIEQRTIAYRAYPQETIEELDEVIALQIRINE